jgi:hypothetical protein
VEGDAEAYVLNGDVGAGGRVFGDGPSPERGGGFGESGEDEIGCQFGAEQGAVFGGAVGTEFECATLMGFGGAPIAETGGGDGCGPVSGGRLLTAGERDEQAQDKYDPHTLIVSRRGSVTDFEKSVWC